MRTAFSIAALAAICSGAFAQHLERVYNRDTGQAFKLKGVKNESKVMGPIVSQKTVFTFENPYKKLTEASVWFSLDWASVLHGFAYWYKHEYVKGVLMDKQKAWFIYTAITSRNEDPGIMVQTAPSSYHAQIYPLAIGHDLRVELTSVGFLRPVEGKLEVPSLTFNEDVPFDMSVRSYEPQSINPPTGQGKDQKYVVEYPEKKPLDMQLYAQRNKDGWTYVAGLVRRGSEQEAIKLKGLQNVMWTKPQAGDTTARWFIGRRKGAGTVSVATTKGKQPIAKNAQRVKATTKGTDTSKLWAHQVLVQKPFKNRREVLNFSMKYQIPSTQTALLAVPEEQMKLFREKAAEWKRQEAERARRERAWQKQRQQNWNQSSGGDPEIRIQLPGAIEAYALLPDGRRIDLRQGQDGFWGGSYDIPATANEGEYKIKVVGVRQDGTTFEQSTSYQVDRTAPKGTAEITGGYLIVRSEAKLARVIAVMASGEELEMKEEEAGVYKLKLDSAKPLTVILYDAAHNKGEIKSIR